MTHEPRDLEQEPGAHSGTSEEPPCTPGEHGGLLAVGLFKLFKAVFFTALGAGALHLVHKDIGDLVVRIINYLPVDPEGRLVGIVMDKADLLDAHHLRRIGIGAIVYAALCLVEGTGLVLRKVWAEYFTVILTALGLPLELFELARHVTGFKIGALVVNLAILLYLLWVLKQKRERATSQPDCQP